MTPSYQLVDGFRIAKAFSPDTFRKALSYKPRNDDIFIVTFPKCGTTWTQHIVINILKRGIPPETYEEFQKLSPFLEITGPGLVETMPRPGAIKTHLPFSLQPYSPQAKYIYVARNPFDCCVSFYHHTKEFPFYQFPEGTFDEYFEIFINGQTDFGDYFDHLLSWYEHRNDPNVLFLVYENMKADTQAAVLKIAKFLNQEYERILLEDDNLMERIIRQTNVENMKNSVNKNFGNFFGLNPNDDQINDPNLPEGLKYILKFMKNIEFNPKSEIKIVRKGIVGDWKEHFSPAQSQQLMAKFCQKIQGTDIDQLWPEFFVAKNQI
ncbi:sulfotransferase 1C2-like [Tachypleus tridentatus]|uniref:sulfotransferase 1C2-like n=1 Tax=Tachypleus tridentatus TaxID=6853 RepID=UPI003FCF0FAB